MTADTMRIQSARKRSEQILWEFKVRANVT